MRSPPLACSSTPGEAGGEDYREFWRAPEPRRVRRRQVPSPGQGWPRCLDPGLVQSDASTRPASRCRVVKFATDITATEVERAQSEAARVAAIAEEQDTVVQSCGGRAEAPVAGRPSPLAISAPSWTGPTPGSGTTSTAPSLRCARRSPTSTSGRAPCEPARMRSPAPPTTCRAAPSSRPARLEETAAALDEITATVKRSADGAKEAVARGLERAEQGRALRRRWSARPSTAMRDIQQSSDQVGQIMGVIDEIAFQTNLLGPERRRRGGPRRRRRPRLRGRRAQRCGRLAQRSAEAAKEIKTLIVGLVAPGRARRRAWSARPARRWTASSPGRHRDRRPGLRDRPVGPGAGDRAQPGQHRGQPDGPGDPAERRHGRGGHRRRRPPAQ